MGCMAFTYRCNYYTCIELLVDTSEFRTSDLRILWFGMGNFHLLRCNDGPIIPYRAKVLPCKIQSRQICRVSGTHDFFICSKLCSQTRIVYTPDRVSYTHLTLPT